VCRFLSISMEVKIQKLLLSGIWAWWSWLCFMLRNCQTIWMFCQVLIEKLSRCLVNKLTLFSCKKLVLLELERFNKIFLKKKRRCLSSITCLWKSHKSRLLKSLDLSVLKPCMETCHIKTKLLPRVFQTKTMNHEYWHGMSSVNLSSKDCVWRVTSVIFKNNFTVINKETNYYKPVVASKAIILFLLISVQSDSFTTVQSSSWWQRGKESFVACYLTQWAIIYDLLVYAWHKNDWLRLHDPNIVVIV